MPLTSFRQRHKKCAVPSCENSTYNEKVKYMCFPINYENFKRWINIINNDKLKHLTHQQVRNRYSICERHFRSNHFQNELHLKLNRNAYPSLNIFNDSFIDDPMLVEETVVIPSTSHQEETKHNTGPNPDPNIPNRNIDNLLLEVGVSSSHNLNSRERKLYKSYKVSIKKLRDQSLMDYCDTYV